MELENGDETEDLECRKGHKKKTSALILTERTESGMKLVVNLGREPPVEKE